MQRKEKKSGIIAGISLIIMAITAGFSYGYVHNNIVTGSPEITLQNLITGKSLFFAGLSGWGIIFITDLIVAVALFYFFSKTARRASLITALIRIIYTLVLGFAIFQLFKIVPVVSSGNSLPDASAATDVISHIRLFDKIWSIGLIIFGLHLLGLGYLSVKSVLVPKLIGYLLYLGGVSYTLIHGARQLTLMDANVINSAEKILSLPMALAEILLALWLVYKGFKRSTGENRS